MVQARRRQLAKAMFPAMGTRHGNIATSFFAPDLKICRNLICLIEPARGALLSPELVACATSPRAVGAMTATANRLVRRVFP